MQQAAPISPRLTLISRDLSVQPLERVENRPKFAGPRDADPDLDTYQVMEHEREA